MAPAAPPRETERSSLPRQLSRYLLFDQIGEGGMARIYLGRSRSGLGGDRLVVIKEILPVFAGSAEFSGLFIEEAKLSATLAHGNIVQILDLGREGDSLYIAMEYVEGLDLRDLLRACSKNRVPLPVEYALFMVMETLRALDYAHRKRDDAGQPLGIVHRDVSPSNVLLSVEGEVKLCDFGIARAMTRVADGGELPEEAIQGKAGYMSPEAARGESIDARSDVFSAGIILYELLAGRRLYRTERGKAPTLEQAQQADIPPLPRRGHPDEERLHAIVGRALARDRDARYESARAMLGDLEEYVGRQRLVASSLRFGAWLMDHFGGEIVERRRARERATRATETGADVRPEPPAAAPAPPVPQAADEAGAALEPLGSLQGVVRGAAPDREARPRSGGAGLMAVVLLALVAGLAALQLLR